MLENFVIIGKRPGKKHQKLAHAKTISDRNIVAAYTEVDEQSEYERQRIEEFGRGNEYLTSLTESAPV